MRILILNWRDPTHPWAGGAEVFLYELAKRWVAAGHKVTWLSSRHPSQTKFEQKEGFTFIRTGGFYRVFLNVPVYYLVHLRGKFDVILDSANGIPFFTPLYSQTPKLALVHHIHKQVFFCELPRGLAFLANLLEQYIAPWIYRRTPFITVSNSSRKALIELGIPKSHISLIYNGVDCDYFEPDRKRETPLILYLGRLRNYKSVDTVIRAMPTLLQYFPTLEFHIAGSGPAEPELCALTQEIGVAEKVQFLGYVSEADKRDLLQKAHVVVNPSLKEGWGLTVMEANACGTVVVGADVPGLRDSIQHQETGLLVPHGDDLAFAEAIRHLLTDVQRRQEMDQQIAELKVDV
ncbi:MAG: glycosyltransferase family 4 protein, partial [Anaerolineales bacterium]